MVSKLSKVDLEKVRRTHGKGATLGVINPVHKYNPPEKFEPDKAGLHITSEPAALHKRPPSPPRKPA
jgi:hypothetical protein